MNVSCTLTICISNLLPNLHPLAEQREFEGSMLKISWSSKNLCISWFFFLFNHKDMLRNYHFISGFWLIFAFKLHWIKLIHITEGRDRNPDLTLTISPKVSMSLCYIEGLWLPLSNPTNATFLYCSNNFNGKYIKLTHPDLTTSCQSLDQSWARTTSF